MRILGLTFVGFGFKERTSEKQFMKFGVSLLEYLFNQINMFTFQQEQIIPASLDEIWEFISNPKNLKEITPPYMGFDVRTPNLPKQIYPGMIIEYRVTPLLGIKLKWVTEITQVIPKQYFIDNQMIGPYKIWHHQHHLTPVEGGVKMFDLIHYLPPFGPLGTLANQLFIKKQLNGIFEYRTKVVNEKFGIFNPNKATKQ